ncbi:MAG: hypothetical protein ABI838_08010 [Chloroflexota bacterium]
MAAVVFPAQRKLGSVSLQRLIELTPLDPAEAVYIALSLLQALEAASNEPNEVLPGASHVRITAAGKVLLDERAVPSPAFRADAVMAVGQMLLPAQAARDPLVEVALDSLAMGAFGRTPEAAAAALRQQLAGLAAPEMLEGAQDNLGAFVRQLHTTGAENPAPPAEDPAMDPRDVMPAGLIGAGVVVLTVLAVALSIAGPAGARAPAAGGPRPTPAAASATPEPVAAPTAPVAASTPAFVPPAPAAAGRMRGVTMTLGEPCQAGGSCATTVELRFAGGGAPTPLAWRVLLYDGCDGSSRALANGSYQAPAGWNRVLSEASVSIPGAHGGKLVVVTISPDAVASEPVEVAGPACG